MDRNEIRQALLKAYEAGWRGSRELKEEYAEEALNDLLGPEDEEKEKTIVDAVEQLPLERFKLNYRGSGSAQ